MPLLSPVAERYSGDHDDADDDAKRVVRDLAGLLILAEPAEERRRLARAVDAAVIDDAAVENRDRAPGREHDLVDGELVRLIDVEAAVKEAIDGGCKCSGALRQLRFAAPDDDAERDTC